MYIWETNLEISRLVSSLDEDNNGVKLSPSKMEGLNRVAVHTSYYACLNKIRQINELKQINTKHGGHNSHNDIIESINKYEDFDDKDKLIRTLKSLKEYRRKADYDAENSDLFTYTSVKRILDKCDNAFEVLKNI